MRQGVQVAVFPGVGQAAHHRPLLPLLELLESLADLAQHIRSEVLRQLRDNIAVVNVYLDLSTAGTGRVAEALEDAGFLFTGILPGGRSGDWLILTYFNGVIVDYDAMQVEEPATRDLLASIRGNDRTQR